MGKIPDSQNGDDQAKRSASVIGVKHPSALPSFEVLYKSKNLQQPRFLCLQPIVHSLFECTTITRHGFEVSLSIEYVISITYEYLFIAYQCLAVLDLVV